MTFCTLCFYTAICSVTFLGKIFYQNLEDKFFELKFFKKNLSV